MDLGFLSKTPASTAIEPEMLGQVRRAGKFRSVGWIGALTSVAFTLFAQLGSIPGNVTFVVAGTLLTVSVLLVNWARLWVRESTEPFQYTFSVGEFEPVPEPEPTATATQRDPMEWLTRDLAEKLSVRVQRLSLLEEPDGGGPEDDDVAVSHVHVCGWYGLRRREDGGWTLEVVPEVRLGGKQAPRRLAQAVNFRLGDPGRAGPRRGPPPRLGDNDYLRLFERVYWSVASEIYAQIRRGVDQKVNLLPPGRLRATAYLYEADDYAASNTLDAYEAARKLYRRALEVYDIGSRPAPAPGPRTTLRDALLWVDRQRRRFRLWRAGKMRRHAGRREILIARAELGYARSVTTEWHLRMLCGTSPIELYEAAPKIKGAIKRLTRVPEDVPERERTLFQAQVTRATTRSLLADQDGARKALRQAELLRPASARKDPEFLFAEGMIEPDRLRSLRLLGQAIALEPALERAHYHRALKYEAVWRGRGRLEPHVARTIDDEYSQVVSINPGNVSAWANRGYICWLLANPAADHVPEPDEPDWRERALETLEAGRQYKEVRREVVVGEIDWNLARLAAEAGEFPAAYEHYIQALSALLDEPRIGFLEYFYEPMTPAVVDRFVRYRERVEAKCAEATPADGTRPRMVKSVLAFVLNDCGRAHLAHYARSGDVAELDAARSAFEGAIRENRKFVLPILNLAHLDKLRGEDAGEGNGIPHFRSAAERLAHVLQREPKCVPAQLLAVEVEAGLMSRAAVGQGGVEDGTDYEEMKRECDRTLVARLGEMLPHSCFRAVDGRVPLATDGGCVDEMLADGRIRWETEFTEIHVAALLQWANVLAFTAPSAADRLCRHLRAKFHPTAVPLLLAHSEAARALAVDGLDGEGYSDPALTVDECRELLGRYLADRLEEDPADHKWLTSLSLLGPEEQRERLLAALPRASSPTTLVLVGRDLAASALGGLGGIKEADPETVEAAVEAFGLAAKADGSVLAAADLVALGDLRGGLGQTKQAVEAYREAIEAGSPELTPVASARAAALLEDTGATEEALELREAAASTPEGALALGDLLTQEGRSAIALAIYEAALAQAVPPGPKQALQMKLAQLLTLIGAFADHAQELLEEVAAAPGPLRWRAQLTLAERLLAGGAEADAARAERLLREASEGEEQEIAAEATVELVRLREGRDEAKEARELCVTAAGADPLVASALGSRFRFDERFDLAEVVYREAARYPDEGPPSSLTVTASLYLAEVLVAVGRLDTAEEEYWRMLTRSPAFAWPSAVLGLAELQRLRGDGPGERFYRQLAERVDVARLGGVTRPLEADLRRRGDERGAAELAAVVAARRAAQPRLR